MTSLGELVLHFFVNSYFAFQLVYLGSELIVDFQKLLGVLRLVVKFRLQLVVLKDCQPGFSLHLLVVQSHKVGLCFFDFQHHFRSEFLSSLNFLPFLLIELN